MCNHGHNPQPNFYSVLHYNMQFKDIHRENTPSNKTQSLTKSINTDIWVISKLNQLFVRGSCTQIKF